MQESHITSRFPVLSIHIISFNIIAYTFAVPILQDDQIEGLHVRKNNEWISIPPIPYALVINIGDLIEVIVV